MIRTCLKVVAQAADELCVGAPVVSKHKHLITRLTHHWSPHTELISHWSPHFRARPDNVLITSCNKNNQTIYIQLFCRK